MMVRLQKQLTAESYWLFSQLISIIYVSQGPKYLYLSKTGGFHTFSWSIAQNHEQILNV